MWPAPFRPPDGTLVQQSREHLLVRPKAGQTESVRLPRGEQERYRAPLAVAPQVQLGGEAAPAAAEALCILPLFAPPSPPHLVPAAC